MILDRAWDSMEFPEEEVVRVHIKEIRKKLKYCGAPSDFIKTVYRIGYQLNPLYAVASSSPSEEPVVSLQIAKLREMAESHQSEQTIRQQATLIDMAPDAFFVYDLDHRIVLWSQGAE
jgi:DNA-binding winged helix-turn-helix (wHTH) protein